MYVCDLASRPCPPPGVHLDWDDGSKWVWTANGDGGGGDGKRLRLRRRLRPATEVFDPAHYHETNLREQQIGDTIDDPRATKGEPGAVNRCINAHMAACIRTCMRTRMLRELHNHLCIVLYDSSLLDPHSHKSGSTHVQCWAQVFRPRP